MSRRISKDNSPWLYENDDVENEDFTEQDLQNGLAQLITDDCTYGTEINWENLRVQTFREAGTLTGNAGLVITLPDGTAYQVSIVRCR